MDYKVSCEEQDRGEDDYKAFKEEERRDAHRARAQAEAEAEEYEDVEYQREAAWRYEAWRHDEYCQHHSGF